MKIISVSAICLILFSQFLWSQPCLPGTTSFNTQEEIDNFQTNYPNCTEIEGFVIISGGNITNLNALSVLTSVGDFWLQNMGSLTSLDGLQNIITVKGTLYINNLPLLSDISALSSLTYIGNRLWFWNNSSVTSIESFSNVMSIGRVDIFNNDALTTLSGIDNIDADSIRDVYIVDNDQLTLCEVLSICNYLNTTGADIIIENNAPGCNSPVEVQDSCETNAVSQYCLPEGIVFETQAQIDSFPYNYPGCTEIEGNVTIQGASITNLNGLSSLTSIHGYLQIGSDVGGGGGNPSLISLSGLESLASIGGDLFISKNDALIDLTGLDNLISVGGYLTINFNSLVSFEGLENITALQRLHVASNQMLTSFEGLNNLTSIADYLFISNNNTLASLIGLEGLTSIGGGLEIKMNNLLADLAGLDNVETIGGRLYIHINPALNSLDGLDNVTFIGERLDIISNESLGSLTGLNNIEPSSIDDLHIYDNPLLTNCDVESICKYLASPNGDVEIYNNTIGCNSPEEVLDSCEAHFGTIEYLIHKNAINIYPNPAADKIHVKADGFGIDEVNVFAITGQQLLAIRTIRETIDISSLSPGMYIVEVRIEGRKVREKLVVK